MNSMNQLFLLLTTVFIGFFAILNPIGNTPVFLSMVGDADPIIIKKVARRAVTAAFVIIAIFCLFGHIIFKLFNITLPAFQIAGGIIVFFIGYNQLQDKVSRAQKSKVIDTDAPYEDMAISPLGIPLLAGPGTISTAMNFVGQGKSFLNTILIILVFATVCVITYLMFMLSKRIADRLKPSLIKAISRIMGLILAVIAVQMVISGVFNVIKEYPF
ncbi:MAG TPA: MarC family protein [Bacteroidales bacterium]|nr:MarC family protein [Bacteroidales bacterium]